MEPQLAAQLPLLGISQWAQERIGGGTKLDWMGAALAEAICRSSSSGHSES